MLLLMHAQVMFIEVGFLGKVKKEGSEGLLAELVACISCFLTICLGYNYLF